MTTAPAARLPLPFHPLLSPIPALAALVASSRYLRVQTALPAYVVCAAIVCVVWVLLWWLTRSGRVAAALASLWTMAALSHQVVASAVLPGGRRLGGVGLWVLVTLASAVVVRVGRSCGGLTRFFNALLICTAVMTVWPVVRDEWQLHGVTAPGDLAMAAPQTDIRRPDVYVLVFDAYGRHDVLRDEFGFDNPLEAELERRGFVVAREATSNYMQTGLSLASSLNLAYLHDLGTRADVADLGHGLGTLIAHNRALATFARAGFDVVVYGSEYSLLAAGPAEEHRVPWLHWSEYDYTMFDGSVVPRLFSSAGLQPAWLPHHARRRQVAWTLDTLAADACTSQARPRLVFAHVLMPHPPFVFEADGTYPRTVMPAGFGNAWHVRARGTGESYERGYINALSYLNPRLLRIVDSIAECQNRRAIVLIQGDHGPAAGLHEEQLTSASVRQRFGALLAMRVPGGEAAALYDTASPVNAMRTVVNAALGLHLPRVEDRAYFTTWPTAPRRVDVTDLLRQPTAAQ